MLQLSSSLDDSPRRVFPVMISPDTNTRSVLFVCVRTGSEAALSDRFVFTSGSALADEALTAQLSF